MKNKVYFLTLIFYGTYSFLSIIAQPRVLNPKYQKTLDHLLKHNVPELSVSELMGCKDSFLILDTREVEEYKISHIESAQFVGFDYFDIGSLKNIPKNRKIVCYCSIGYRSERIASNLIQNGYSNVYNLYGSIFEWANMNYPLVDQNGKLTNKLHPYSRLWGKFIDNPKTIKIFK